MIWIGLLLLLFSSSIGPSLVGKVARNIRWVVGKVLVVDLKTSSGISMLGVSCFITQGKNVALTLSQAFLAEGLRRLAIFPRYDLLLLLVLASKPNTGKAVLASKLGLSTRQVVRLGCTVLAAFVLTAKVASVSILNMGDLVLWHVLINLLFKFGALVSVHFGAIIVIKRSWLTNFSSRLLALTVTC